MEVKKRLEELKQQILTVEAGSRAFQTWEELKTDLSPTQRVRILTAWNIYLRTGNQHPVIETIRQVKKNLDE